MLFQSTPKLLLNLNSLFVLLTPPILHPYPVTPSHWLPLAPVHTSCLFYPICSLRFLLIMNSPHSITLPLLTQQNSPSILIPTHHSQIPMLPTRIYPFLYSTHSPMRVYPYMDLTTSIKAQTPPLSPVKAQSHTLLHSISLPSPPFILVHLSCPSIVS